MAYYETVMIARQDVSAAHAEKLADEFAAIIKDHKGKLVSKEYWGLKNLAYKIKKNKKGHYILLNLEATPEGLAEMERKMSLNEDILRFLSIKVEEISKEPSVMMKNNKKENA
ncbi:MAG: 30S ribosomal protein S6 [Alphaproteobacteria bacterium]|jgi:small subunit ribosomal protein S6|nr:30S ribosomal protein S6 [Alphaproteobacteria bacterium]MCV6599250.1 30S ribosomal protein S6 [Alphaproteobacteria bacterium]